MTTRDLSNNTGNSAQQIAQQKLNGSTLFAGDLSLATAQPQPHDFDDDDDRNDDEEAPLFVAFTKLDERLPYWPSIEAGASVDMVPSEGRVP